MTIAGALVQQNAEALAGIAFAQMVRKGVPVAYGGFTSIDYEVRPPAFGNPGIHEGPTCRRPVSHGAIASPIGRRTHVRRTRSTPQPS
ncbi:MAG: trimethylamine methyltransferase family protein [Rhizobiaceae bacterium]|nr:trimethylamine methyltransferase family protein [Rhizobiaceae bacterium]